MSLGLAIFAEVACAILVMIGFKTRWATIPLMITMLVAAFYAHGSDPFSKKELSLTFFTLFLSINSGPGKYSVDEWIRRRQ
jgi:putative oxidoreductase